MRLLAALAALALALAASAGTSSGAERDVRREVQRALAQKSVADRANGLDAAFRDADDAAAAEAVVDLVFQPDQPQVVLDVGVRALGAMVSPGAQDVVTKALGDPRRFRRVMLAEALSRATGDTSRVQLLSLSRTDDPRVRAAALTSLGDRREPESALALTTALDDPEWTVRSAAIRGLRLVGDPKAVPYLTERMRREDGRLLDDLADACAALTGRRHGPDPSAYERAVGSTGGTAWTAPPPSFRTPLFETRSRRVLFVLSTGETMKDPVHGAGDDVGVNAEIARAGKDLADALAAAKTKMDTARVHLQAMLRTLADGVEFDVLTYTNSPTFAFGQLTRADDAARRKAESRVSRITPGGMPDVHEAIHRIFDARAKDPFESADGWDTVVFVSDGALPTNGFNDRREIAPRAARWNRARQIRFVAVSVGQTDPYVPGTLAGGPPPGMSVSIP